MARFVVLASSEPGMGPFIGPWWPDSRDGKANVEDIFPIVRKNDENAHGECSTKRVILQIYDALAEASRTGKPYVSPLGPTRRAT